MTLIDIRLVHKWSMPVWSYSTAVIPIQHLHQTPRQSLSGFCAKMSTDYKFEGWMGEDERSAEGNMVWREYEPKKWEETDIDIRITHCGICGSDIHVLRSGWVSSALKQKP